MALRRLHKTYLHLWFIGFFIHSLQADDIRRLDPDSDVTVTWSVDAADDFASYDVITINVNNSVDLFSCRPVNDGCQNSTTKNARLRFVSVFSSHYLTTTLLSHEDKTMTDNGTDVIQDRLIAVGFQLKSVKAADAGVYKLTMSLGINQTVNQVVIYVYQRPSMPTLIGALGQLIVGEGMSLTCTGSVIRSLPVAYRNTSSLIYTWYRDNEKVNEKSSETLTIESLSEREDGVSYYCAVREENSSLEAVASKVTKLDVCVDDVTLQTNTVGGKEYLECAWNCRRECKYTWFDERGQTLTNDSRLYDLKAISGQNLTCQASTDKGRKLKSTVIVYLEQEITRAVVALSFLTCLSGVVLLCALVYNIRRRRRRNPEDGRNGASGGTNEAPAPDDNTPGRYQTEARKPAANVYLSASEVGSEQRPDDDRAATASDPNTTGAQPGATYANVHDSVSGVYPLVSRRPETGRVSQRRNVVTVDFDAGDFDTQF